MRAGWRGATRAAGVPSGAAARRHEVSEPGSNNWVVSGALSATGSLSSPTIRTARSSNPSLRYIVHLNAPGWNVIGAGEPPFVGVAPRPQRTRRMGADDRRHRSAGRVRRGDESGEPERGAVQGGWEPLRIVREEIAVKGAAAADGRAEVQPARPDLLRGPRAKPGVRSRDRRCTSPARRRTWAACGWRRRRTAASSSTPRCTGRRRPKT